MLDVYLNSIREHGKTLILYIGLVNSLGVELSGGSPAYVRKAVTWANDGTGVMRPSVDIVFDVPAGLDVAGWRGYSAVSAGTGYGGASVVQENFTEQGTYKLIKTSTAVRHVTPA